ncbi:MAG: MFS transporter [Gammaproteobacteria bacterium]|nr:MFS transporter [Gammaproteobacteria bacterium]
MSTLARPSTLVFYGVGAISPTIKNNLFVFFLFYYYNQVLGLEAYLVSLALALSLVVDAITDPLLGYVSDHTHSRLGRRHPYIYFSLVPSPICYYLLMSLEYTSTQASLFAQLFLMATLLRLAWTFFNVPRQALGAELTKDYHQRNTLSAISTFFGWFGGAVMWYMTTAVFLGESYDNKQGYRDLAFWGAAVILVTGTIFALGTHREIPNLEPPRQKRPIQMRAILQEIKETLSHRSWLMLFVAGVITSIHAGVVVGLGIYFNSYFWEWKPSDVAIFAITNLVGSLIISSLASRLARNWDKKQLAVGLYIIVITLGQIPLILRLSDLWLGTSILPENGPIYSALWWVLISHSFITSTIGTLAGILVGSMTADIVEDSQATTGRRSEGLFFAGPHLIEKCVTGLGYIVKGIILTAVGFSVAATGLEKVDAIERMAAVVIVLGIVLPALSLYMVSKYEITESSHESKLQDLGYKEQETEPFS